MGADATALDRLPLPPTACRQNVAGGMVAPAAKDGPIIDAMDLANLGALLNKLKPPPLLAILEQGHLYSKTWNKMSSAAASSRASFFGTEFTLHLAHWSVWRSQCGTACELHRANAVHTMPSALTNHGSAAVATPARMKSPLVAMEGAAGTAVAMEGVAAAEAEVAAAESKSSTHNFFLA